MWALQSASAWCIWWQLWLDVLGAPQGLAQDKAAQLSAQWKQSFISMSQSMIGKTLTVNELVDMEWKFGGQYGVFVPEEGGSS